VHGSSVAYDSVDFTQNGVVGDPTEASRDRGKELFEKSVEELVRLIDWLKENEIGVRDHK
ncbi:MAG: creatininase family protein, partial [Halobacteria archaeon]|nr:creatininase family protein [Halobacteria archaeon]